MLPSKMRGSGRPSRGSNAAAEVSQKEYRDIVTPPTAAPSPREGKKEAPLVIAGASYAREKLRVKDHACLQNFGKQPGKQHVVAERHPEDTVASLYASGKIWHPSHHHEYGSEDSLVVGRPWHWRVSALCGQELRNASIKAGRPFIELPVCERCAGIALAAQGETHASISA